MGEIHEFKCSWSGCATSARNHVRFGNRTFGVAEILPAPDQNYTVIHRNLCDKHLEEVRQQYLDVRVFDIGECPTCGRRPS
ncbi:hypothetical protein BH10ACI2_BH10ACI2_09100 [soil metagenome]